MTGSQSDGETPPGRSRFLTLVGFNGIAQIAPIVTVLALTPVLISRLGLDRFGIWSLALFALSALTSLDGGVSASLARFFAIYAARSEKSDSVRLLTGSWIVFLILALPLTLASFVLAPILVPLLHIPPGLEVEAVWAFRWLPSLVVLGLASDSVASLLQGNGQFRALAGATCVSVAVFAVAIIVLVQPGAHLSALFVAAALRYVALAVAGLVFARKQLMVRRPLLPSWPTIREVGNYAARMQFAALTNLVNAELDGFVVAAVAPVRYVGLYTIGLQAASGVRSVPLYAFSPLLTRLATTFRREGRSAAAGEFERLEHRWLPSVLGFGVVAVAAIGFAVPIWLGDRYVLSGVTAAILLAGYTVHVSLTGLRTCYVRAIGRPGLEVRYSTVWMVLNALLTVPLALAAGMLGVVSATAGTAALASAYFVVLCRRAESLPLILPGKRWWLVAAVAACVTVAGELAIRRSHVTGFAGLILSGTPALAGLAVIALDGRRRRAADLPFSPSRSS
jgi:O-antigen/teichoic acid export membrane protein